MSFVTGDVLRHVSLEPNAVLIQKPFREPDIVQAIERALAAKSARADGLMGTRLIAKGGDRA